MRQQGFGNPAKGSETRLTLLLLAFGLLLSSVGCGVHSMAGSPVAQFPDGAVTSSDVEKLLKYDARVKDFSMNGNKLVVEVNSSWMTSPPGIQERVTGQWYGQWQAANGGTAKSPKKDVSVLITNEGADIAQWTTDGFKPVAKIKAQEEAAKAAEGE